MDKSVLVPYLQAGNPPVLHIGMITVSDVNASPASERTFVAVIEVFEAVQIMKIPSQ